jgi:2-alkyl-3-oxoalkanoate reductase
MRRALVTGATGGLGIALVEALLAQGYSVLAAGRDRAVGERLETAGASFSPGDLTHPGEAWALVEGVDVVFHAAALSSPWGPAAAFRAINVEATERLLMAAREAGVGAFVFVSTPSVYAEPRDRLNLTEASPFAARFANAYVRTKFAAEQSVIAANAAGFATVIIRPRALVGPDDKVLLPRLVRVARRGRFPLFREGRALIDLTDVRDAAAAIVAADARRETVAGRAFNVSGARPATIADTLAEVFAALGLSPRMVGVPYALAAAGCRVAEAVCAALPGRPEPPATAYSLAALAFSQTFDVSAARDGLGWAPRFTPSEAIARTAEAWKRDATV